MNENELNILRDIAKSLAQIAIALETFNRREYIKRGI